MNTCLGKMLLQNSWTYAKCVAFHQEVFFQIKFSDIKFI